MLDYGSYSNEYIITNSFGSFSSSNFKYGNTRKYHGLLVAGTDTFYKYNVLNRVIDEIYSGSYTFDLSTNIYKNEYLNPQSYTNLEAFYLYPYPTWKFIDENFEVEKNIILLKKENSIVLSYKINSKIGGIFKLKPLINFRDMHSVNTTLSDSSYHLSINHNYTKVHLSEGHALNIFAPGTKFTDKKETYYDFYYPDEEKRGYLAQENLLQIGSYEINLPKGESKVFFKFSYNNNSDLLPSNLWTTPTYEKNILEEHPVSKDIKDFNIFKKRQAKLFLSEDGICAGYPWFDEWARDTFIALPGIAFSPKKQLIAIKIFEKWGKSIKNGLLPNRVMLDNVLNSLDGIFWFIVRLYEFCLLQDDFRLARKFLPEIESVFIHFQKNTNNIHITDDGFLYDNNSDDALTWMDAKVDGKPVIDRSGMAVEIQALWYNYIRILITLKEKFNDRTNLTALRKIKIQIERNFENIFWNNSENCLLDCVRGNFQDRSIRPNQVVVVYLPFKLLGKRKSKMVLATIEQKLLTKVGIRTLAREDKSYIGNYEGDQKQRDLAYHQGTIWPFILGFYLSAYKQVYSKSKSSKTYVDNIRLEFWIELQKQGLNYIPEVFSGNGLKPNGCLAQAWNMLIE